MTVKVEKLDVRNYRVSNERDAYILRPMRSGVYRWGMFYEGDQDSDANLLQDALSEKEMLAEAVFGLMR